MPVSFSRLTRNKKSGNIELEGAAQLDRNLRRLSDQLRRKLGLNALHAASDVMWDDVRRRTPKGDSGQLAARNRRVKDKKFNEVRIENTKYYARMIEFGTKPHRITPKKRRKKALTIEGGLYAGADHPGIQGKAFFRPAFDATRNKLVVRFGRELDKRVDRLMSRQGKR